METRHRKSRRCENPAGSHHAVFPRLCTGYARFVSCAFHESERATCALDSGRVRVRDAVAPRRRSRLDGLTVSWSHDRDCGSMRYAARRQTADGKGPTLPPAYDEARRQKHPRGSGQPESCRPPTVHRSRSCVVVVPYIPEPNAVIHSIERSRVESAWRTTTDFSQFGRVGTFLRTFAFRFPRGQALPTTPYRLARDECSFPMTESPVIRGRGSAVLARPRSSRSRCASSLGHPLGRRGWDVVRGGRHAVRVARRAPARSQVLYSVKRTAFPGTLSFGLVVFWSSGR